MQLGWVSYILAIRGQDYDETIESGTSHELLTATQNTLRTQSAARVGVV